MQSSSSSFVIGAIFGVLLFIVFSLLAAHFASDCGLPAWFNLAGCADDIRRAGFPFVFYEAGGFDGRNRLEMGTLIFDLVCGVGLALSGGWLTQRFWKR